MTTEEKKEKIKEIVLDEAEYVINKFAEKIDKLFEAKAINIEAWDVDNTPMIIPKCILAALLDQAILSYNGRGTGYKRQMTKEIKNIRYFL